MTDDREVFDRRDFLRYSSFTAASAAVFYSAAMTTDALAVVVLAPEVAGEGDQTQDYHYANN